MSYCRTVTVDGIDVKLQFATQKDAEEASEKELQNQAREFIAYVKGLKK